MKKLSKILLTGLMILVCALCLSACSTGSDSASNEVDISGIWIYEGPSTQDPTWYVELNLEDNKEFELNINSDILADSEQQTHSALITGTYEDNGKELVLIVDNSKDPEKLLEPDTEEITLGYELSGDSELITITGLSEYVKDLPETMKMERGNTNE